MLPRHDEGPALTVLTVDLESDDQGHDLDDVLSELAHGLAEASWKQQRRVCVDVRTPSPSATSCAAAPIISATVAAVRGLVQSYTLECGPDAPPVNLLLTTSEQVEDRARSWRYLDSEHGGLARGATFDLRSAT